MLHGLLFAIATFVTSGCYASHEAVDVARCAPHGVHMVTTEVTSSSGECGLGGVGGLSEVTIPPTAEGFFGTPDVGEVVMVGPCRWEVHAEQAMPDLSSTIDGWIDTSDGTVRGSFDIELSGFAGVCTATFVWTEVD